MNKPILLDKDTGCSWKGRRGPRLHALGHDSKGFVRLHDLHAIQLITEACTSDSDKSPRGFYSYEINLVLNDARHDNIIDHGNLNDIRDDAQAIATFLEVPAWGTPVKTTKPRYNFPTTEPSPPGHRN